MDNQFFVEVPICDGSTPALRYRLLHHRHDLRFVALNLRGWQGKMLVKTEELRLAEKLVLVNMTASDQRQFSLQIIPISEMRESGHAAVLTRGVAEPSTWFSVPSPRGNEFPLQVTLCQRLRAFGLGSILFA